MQMDVAQRSPQWPVNMEYQERQGSCGPVCAGLTEFPSSMGFLSSSWFLGKAVSVSEDIGPSVVAWLLPRQLNGCDVGG